jgi:hypothetical protein
MKYKSILILFIVFHYGCEYVDDRLVVVNNTDHNIEFVLFDKDSLVNLYDGYDLDSLNTFRINHIISLNPGEKKIKSRLGAKNEWEKVVLSGDSQKLYVFLFDNDTINKYDWKTIVTKEKYQNRLSFSLKELQTSNWNVIIN